MKKIIAAAAVLLGAAAAGIAQQTPPVLQNYQSVTPERLKDPEPAIGS